MYTFENTPPLSTTLPMVSGRFFSAVACAEVKTRPDFLRSSLEMISQLLLASDPPNSPAHMVERTKQVQQAASMAFKDICVGGKHHLQVRPRWEVM